MLTAGMTAALSPAEWEVISLSLKVALWSVVASLPLALAVAWLLARTSFPGKSLFDALVHLPLVLPPVVVGYLLLLSLGRKGPLGGLLYDWFGITLVFSWAGAALACAVMGFPLMVRAIRLSMETIDPKLEQAARTLGAGVWGRFLAVTLPLSLPGVVTGTLLSFARSLGEFGAVVFIAGNLPGFTEIVSLLIYIRLDEFNYPGAAALAFILLLTAFLTLAATNALQAWQVRYAERSR